MWARMTGQSGKCREVTSASLTPRVKVSQRDPGRSFFEMYHVTLFRTGSNSGTSYTPSTEDSQVDVEQLVTYKVSQVTLSPENTIFHYIHLDVGEGVFLAPLSQTGSPYHTDIVHQFRIACHIIHANFQVRASLFECGTGFQSCCHFQTTLHCRDAVMQGSPSKAWLNRNLIAVREQVDTIYPSLRPGLTSLFLFPRPFCFTGNPSRWSGPNTPPCYRTGSAAV